MKFTGGVRSGFSSVFLFGAALAVALGVTSSTSRVAARGAQQPTEDNGIAPSAAAQIESLIREKETRTPAERKIDSQLLYAWRMQQGLPVAPGVQTLEVDVPYAADGHVIVEVSAKALTPNLLSQLNGLSREVKETGPANVEVHVALSQVEQIAAEPDVLFVQPRQGRFTSRVGPRPSRDQMIPRAARRKAVLESLRAALAARTLAASDGHARPDPVHSGTRRPSAPGESRRHGGRLGELAGGPDASRRHLPRPDRRQRHGREDRRAVGRRPAPRGRAGVRRSRRGHRAAGTDRCRRRRHGDARADSRHGARRAAVLRDGVHLDHLVRRQHPRPARGRLRHHRRRRRLLRRVAVPGRPDGGGHAHQRRRRHAGGERCRGARAPCTSRRQATRGT